MNTMINEVAEDNCFPDWDESLLVKQRRECSDSSFLFECISRAYSLLIPKSLDNVHAFEPLVTINEEVIWQQLALQNRRLKKVFYKLKSLIDAPSIDKCLNNALTQHCKEDTTISFGDDYKEDEESGGNRLDDDELLDKNDGQERECLESGSILINLEDDDLKNLEEELNELTDEDDMLGAGEVDIVEEKREERKFRKSAVDDNFFSLAEMEEYLDQQEKNDSSKNFFEQVPEDDVEMEAADYRYAEFYGESDYKQKKAETIDRKKKTKNQDDSEEGLVSKKKRVHFLNDHEEMKNGNDSERAPENDRILLGATEDVAEKKESNFQKRQKKLKAQIAALEEENLLPRKWELSGEVTAMDREENSLLEKHLDYDHGRKIAPVITVDKTEKLEALIVQRIKDKAFDDVERMVREPDTARRYRVDMQEEISKKSLAEVYEEQYQKTQNPELEQKKEDQRKVEIERRMSELFKKLDTLFHYKTNPPEVRPEIRIINNMASLRKEEVGPLASTEEMLVAPEEVKRHEKGEVKGNDERTDTDRARERRKKKKVAEDNKSTEAT